MEDRSCGRIDVVSAVLAHESSALLQGMEFRISPTAGACDLGAPVIHFHELRETSRVARVHLLKLLKGAFGHWNIPYLRLWDIPTMLLKCCQGINARNMFFWGKG
jgi:hypothetical protein